MMTRLCPLLLLLTVCAAAPVSVTEPARGAASAGAVTRAQIVLDGVDEPHTPPSLNRIRAFRYYIPESPAPRTSLVLIPGLNSGPNTLDLLARALVARGSLVEVWVVEPRPSLLQDRRGVAAALDYRNPDFALAYYFGGMPIDGQSFHYVDRRAADYAAFWGLDLHLRDIRAVVQEVRRRSPATHVILGGHSLGGIMATLYAGYDFGRIPGPAPVPLAKDAPAPSADAGARDLQGLLLLDGLPLRIVPHLGPNAYTHGFHLAFVGRIPGIDDLVSLDPGRRADPFTDTASLARTEDSLLFDVVATYAYLRPDDASYFPFPPRRGLSITNEALLGAILSDRVQPDLFIRTSVGSPRGIFQHVPDLEGLVPGGLLNLDTGKPVPGDTLIRWIPYDRSTPPGHVDLRRLEEAILRPDADFTQWYVPWRLVLDVGLAAGLDTSDPFDRQFLSLTQVRYMSLPLLIIGAGRGLIRTTGETAFYLSRIATPPTDVSVEILPGYTHLDLEEAADNPAVPRILGWVDALRP
jgi:hypothetical protein